MLEIKILIYQNYLPIISCVLISIILRFALTMSKQRWATTFQHTITYLVLPIITFSITKVISGNIALSLGMVGALSIVRFRNPVKSPLELVIFFYLITIGICASVNYLLSWMLCICVSSLIVSIYYTDVVLKMYGYHVFNFSFNEGEVGYFVEITSNELINDLEKNISTIHYSYNIEEKVFLYRLFVKEKFYADNLTNTFRNNPSINSINVSLN